MVQIKVGISFKRLQFIFFHSYVRRTTCFTPTRNNKRLRGRLRDALECVVALARTLPEMPNSFVRFACPGPLVDRLYVGELKRDVS